MRELENKTLQNFLERFIEELSVENDNREPTEYCQIDIPYIVSSLYQAFDKYPEKFSDLIGDLEKYFDYSFNITDSKNEYDGIIDVDIHLGRYFEEPYNDYDFPNHYYQLRFSYDTRNYGYCECTSDIQDYREDKHCCGHGCDASFCEFSLHKILNVLSHSWEGDEHDYWEFEDEFYMNNEEIANKKKEKEKSREIFELKNRIKADQKRLAELESE